MSSLLHIFTVIFVVSLALMGLAFALGRLIAWYRGRQFTKFLEEEATRE